MLLPDDIVQTPRAHARRQRRVLGEIGLEAGAKKVSFLHVVRF